MSTPRAAVTGGSKGIGLAVVERLAGAGFAVVAMGRDEAALAKAATDVGGEVETAVCDVSDPDSIAAAFGATGPFDVLVNNAGVADSAPVRSLPVEQWDRLMRVNALGPLLCIQQVLPGMLEKDHGRIVTVASMAGHQGGPYMAAYAASKHAVLGMMRSLATEVAGTGVTANSVCPGYVRTPMTEETVARIRAKTGRSDEEAMAVLVGSTRLGRLIEPDEVAAAVAYLVSDEAGAVNGQSILIDGGDLQQ